MISFCALFETRNWACLIFGSHINSALGHSAFKYLQIAEKTHKKQIFSETSKNRNVGFDVDNWRHVSFPPVWNEAFSSCAENGGSGVAVFDWLSRKTPPEIEKPHSHTVQGSRLQSRNQNETVTAVITFCHHGHHLAIFSVSTYPHRSRLGENRCQDFASLSFLCCQLVWVTVARTKAKWWSNAK